MCIYLSATGFLARADYKNMRTRDSRLAKIMRPREKTCVPIRVILRFWELWVVILHIKLKGIEHRAPWRQICCYYTHQRPPGWGQKVIFFLLKVFMLHIKLKWKKCRPTCKVTLGFRKHCRTTDHILSLKTLIDKAFKSSSRLYTCFVDLSKAFDTINRQALFHKMSKYNIKAHFWIL